MPIAVDLQAPTAERRHSGRAHALAPIAFALLMAVAASWVFTRNNDFPLNYHPDERGKVLQLIAPDQQRNFNHPLLMLEAANSVRKAFGVPDEERAVAIAGRGTSAALAAVAVLALALAGYSIGGYRGLVLCGGMVGLCPALDVYAHYFKEDTALIAGLALAILGASRVVGVEGRGKQLGAAALMGVGCGAAISSKYVGLVALGPCLFALCLAPSLAPRLVLSRFASFAVTAAASVFLINLRAFESLVPPRLAAAASGKLGSEFIHATSGHEGLALAVPNSFLLNVSFSEWMPDVWLFLAIGVLVLARRSFCNRWALTLGGFVLAFAAALSWSAFPFPRYALPITVLGYFVAGQLIAGAVSRIDRPEWVKRAALLLCLGLILAMQGSQCWRFNAQFADDSRQRLREWVARNLDEETTVLAEDYTALAGRGDPWRYPGQGKMRARVLRPGPPDYRGGTLAELRAAGFDYIAVAEPRYERYFRPGIHATSQGQREDLLRHQRFYRELFAQAELVWHSVPSPPSHAYLDPELRLYRIAGGNAAGFPAHDKMIRAVHPRQRDERRTNSGAAADRHL